MVCSHVLLAEVELLKSVYGILVEGWTLSVGFRSVGHGGSSGLALTNGQRQFEKQLILAHFLDGKRRHCLTPISCSISAEDIGILFIWTCHKINQLSQLNSQVSLNSIQLFLSLDIHRVSLMVEHVLLERLFEFFQLFDLMIFNQQFFLKVHHLRI